MNSTYRVLATTLLASMPSVAALAQPSTTAPGSSPSSPNPAPNPNHNLPISSPPSSRAPAKPFKQDIPSAAYKLDMLSIPADSAKGIKPFWISATEVTWEAFDVYIYRLDESEPKGVSPRSDRPAEGQADSQSTSAPAGIRGPDGVTRPTKPYLPPDRGFGHEGYAAIGMSKLSATEFCMWLSVKTGRHYRLPTEQEWEHAALAGGKGPYCFGDDASKLPDYAWFADDSDDATHPVAKKQPNAWGLYDIHGNAAEWCETPDGSGVTKGGSYRSSADDEKATARKLPDRAWNASDPQIPKSKWWLANGPFVGFRIVCDNPTANTSPPSDAKPSMDAKPSADPKPLADPQPDAKPDPKK